MLRAIHISGLGVIDDLELELHPGLNVLTGETGAGKTMITVGLALALGTRATSTIVRAGAARARAEALFELDAGAADPSLRDWIDDGQLVLARTVPLEGKASARLGGQLATASALAAAGARLVEVHGQHHAQRLLDPAVQTAFLDRFAGDPHAAALADYREAYGALREARSSLDRLAEVTRDREREADLLAYQVREIESAGPTDGESEHLVAEESRLGHVERLLEASAAAEQALGGDDGAADVLGVVARLLDEAAALDAGTAGFRSRAEALAVETSELARDVRDYREGLAIDPDRLQVVRERIATLRGLQRKYGETDTDVVAFLADASVRLAELTGADDRIRELTDDVARLETVVAERAEVVTAGRVRAAAALGPSITAEIDELGMPGAHVEVALTRIAEPSSAGAERAELRLAGGPGAPALPIATAASGGELSRTMLACRSVLADLDDVPTLVFDEVDAGIGGRAGLAVGTRLAGLAAERQVIVVTHLPQIACFADSHALVTKRDGVAEVAVLDDAARVAELSRMLAGIEESESAVSHATELLEQGRSARSGRPA